MMEVFVNDDWEPLNKGEGLRFYANQAHGYRNCSSEIACFHNIIHY
jgi:XRE family transcriptional regulator, regulator of sulfur utilization